MASTGIHHLRMANSEKFR